MPGLGVIKPAPNAQGSNAVRIAQALAGHEAAVSDAIVAEAATAAKESLDSGSSYEEILAKAAQLIKEGRVSDPNITAEQLAKQIAEAGVRGEYAVVKEPVNEREEPIARTGVQRDDDGQEQSV